jgi:hypothetical protein
MSRRGNDHLSPIVYTYTVYAFDNETHTRHDRPILVREKNGKEGAQSREPNSVHVYCVCFRQ